MISTNTDGNPISARWGNAVKDPGMRLTKVDLFYARQPNPVLTDLEVIGGSITQDKTSNTRRSGSIQLANTDLLTATPTLSLEPFGLELGIRWGVQYADGTTEYVNVGVFPFDTTEWTEGTGRVPTLTLNDRSFSTGTESSQTGSLDYSGVYATQAIVNLLNRTVFTVGGVESAKVDPSVASAGQIFLIVDPAVAAADFKLPGGSPFQSDYWSDISSVAALLGAQIYFDVDGVNLILRPVDVLSSTTSSFTNTVRSGDRGALIEADRTLTRSGAWNAVRATGALAANAAATATPPTVFVSDNNPRSKTYYGGPFGKIVNVVTSDTITNRTALLAYAKTILTQGLGVARSISITMLADATLEVGDVILVVFTDTTTELHMIQSITLDLATGSMTLQTVGQNQT